MPLGFIGAEFTLKEPIAVTDYKAQSQLTKMDYMLFGTGWAILLTVKAICVRSLFIVPLAVSAVVCLSSNIS